MKACHLSLSLLFFLLAPAARPQSDRPPISLIETVAGGEPASIPGQEFNVSGLGEMAADLEGNVYFSIQRESRVYRFGRDGRVAAYAGNGVHGKPIEGASALSSPLLGPYALATDVDGNLYITCQNALLVVDAGSQTISTVFHLPYREPGAPELIHNIEHMVIGPDGKLYVADGGDHRIKSFSFTTRGVTIIAGNGAVGPAQPGAIATASPLRYPHALAVASDGTVYFGTQEPGLFSVSPSDGKLGNFPLHFSSEVGPLTEVPSPFAMVLDQQDVLYIAQANCNRVFSLSLTTGAVSVLAGTGTEGFRGDGGLAGQAQLFLPTQLALGPSGTLFVGEISDIRSVDLSTRLIATAVGRSPTTAVLPAVDPARKLSEPALAMAGPDGSLYVTSSFSDRLLRLNPDGQLASVAGGGELVSMMGKPGPADQVALHFPEGLWFDANGDIYFSDYDNRIVRRFDPHTKFVDNFAQTGKQANSAGVFLYWAGALVADSDSFFLSDPNANCVWRISRQDRAAEIYLGVPPDWMVRGADSAGFKLAAPAGLALDAVGNLYVADGSVDQADGRILRVEHGSRAVSPILSGLHHPAGLAFQSPEVLCFSEAGAPQVRCLNLQTHAIQVMAGTGKAGLGGDGGAAECAQLNRPMGISFDAQGNLYIADTGNQRIRLVHPGTQPARCNP
jgi:sugar lactone lactonase YvrE